MQQKQLPRAVLSSFRECAAQRGDDTNIKIAARGDLGKNHTLQNTYLILTESALYFGSATVTHEWVGRGRKPVPLPEESVEFSSLSLSEIANPTIDNQVMGGLLRVTVAGEDRILCRFSGSCMQDMAELCRAMQDMTQPHPPKEGGRPPRPPRKGPPQEKVCPKCGMPYPDPQREFCPRCTEKRTVFMRVLAYFRPYRVQAALMILFIILAAICEAVLPYLSSSLFYDNVLGQDEAFAASLGLPGQFTTLLLLLVLTAALLKILDGVFGLIYGRISATLVPKVVYALKNTVYQSMQRLSVAFYTKQQTGGLMQRMGQDTREVFNFFVDVLPYAISNVFIFFFSAVIMFASNWKLALLSLCLLPPLFYLSYRLMPLLWRAHGARAKVRRKMQSHINDNLVGARVVKAFGQEEQEVSRFDTTNDRLCHAEIQLAYRNNINTVSFSFARELPTVLVWGFGAWMILNSAGSFKYGELLTFVNYLAMMQGPMNFMSSLTRMWSQSMSAAQRVFEIIDAPAEITEAANPVEKDIRGEITVNDVSFGYEPNQPVLEHISLDVIPGELLGILGGSGSGKSTLVNLISRLYDVDEGEILLDGVNVKDLSFASLRGAVAMVSQETYIFMGTIAENIAYAKPNATHEEILNAAAQAGAHGFICKLPDGYDTIIGTGGHQLSGGERQRLSIARAILTDPEILVLDEATASVDTETERAIQTSLEQLSKGRTILSIAHRLSTLRDADRLLVLDHGKIAETGTHAELLEQQGVYYKLYELQTRALATRGFEGKEREEMEEAFSSKVLEEERKSAEEMIAIHPMTPENTVFTATEGGFVSMEYQPPEGEKRVYPRVSLHRCFPFSNPENDIAVCDPVKNNREIGLIHDLSDFPKEICELLKQQLELRYYHPIITKILTIKEEMGCSYWDVETKNGTAHFAVRMGGTHIYSIGANRYLIEDLDGNRFEIPDLTKMSSREQKLLDLFL